jgi:hypothetical protein
MAVTLPGLLPILPASAVHPLPASSQQSSVGDSIGMLSGHNTYWMWGPGRASDRRVLVVDALGRLRPYFASCRLLTTYNPPYHVQNEWSDIQIGVCAGPVASWHVGTIKP